MVQITKNLVLQSIEANKWTYDDKDREITICWQLWFSFHGIEGFTALVTDEAIKLPYASFSMIESDEGDLHESFSDTIEDNWKPIIEAVKKWEDQNLEEQAVKIVELNAKAEFLFEFGTLEHWVFNAQSWFSPYRRNDIKTVCLDANGNVLTTGKDFQIAKERGTYPVKAYKLVRVSEV